MQKVAKVVVEAKADGPARLATHPAAAEVTTRLVSNR